MKVCSSKESFSTRAVRCCADPSSARRHGRRAVLSMLPLLAAAPPAVATAGVDIEPFLKSSGAKGFLAEEEEVLLELRKDKELSARDELERERSVFEAQARGTQRGLCATPFGIDVVGITELIAISGALVGGLVARQRKQETERLNEQLRRINMQLRQQARAGTLYAPGLSYAPVPRSSVAPSAVGSPEVATAEAGASTATLSPPAGLDSTDEVTSPEQEACRDVLREGKRLLRSQQGSAAIVRFEKALMMSQKLADLLLQRRALRGLAASSRMQGNSQQAIKHLQAVLAISAELQEYTGDADAYGSIADIYADMGEFEKAATYYDNYINKMQEDGQAV